MYFIDRIARVRSQIVELLLLILDQAYVGQEMGHVIHPPMKVTII